MTRLNKENTILFVMFQTFMIRSSNQDVSDQWYVLLKANWISDMAYSALRTLVLSWITDYNNDNLEGTEDGENYFPIDLDYITSKGIDKIGTPPERPGS